MKICLAYAVCILLLMPHFAFAADTAPASKDPASTASSDAKIRKPIRISESSVLPLRVLTRPMSALYKGPDEASGVVQGNLPTFLPYYVYTRPDGEERAAERGWYEVGSDNRGSVVGWLKASDVFEWKQTMCLTYTHPEMRKRVLMFDSEIFLKDLIDKDASARTSVVEDLYRSIDSGNIPKDFSVVAIEPKMAVDFTKQFYLLPILDHKVIKDMDGREARMLQLTAVSNTERGPIDIEPGKDTNIQVLLKKLRFDIVWVIDTTRSMEPYINATRDVVVEVSKSLASDENLSQRLRFGVWGYRDSLEEIPAIEYLTKNYTPALQNIKDFSVTMGTVKETKVDSVDFPEDVFSGLSDAIQKTAWTPDAIRFIILVGDAPSHELGHKWNYSGLDATTLRILANENNITLLAIQVRPQGAIKYQQIAEKQFKTLALGPGMDTPAYYSVDGRDMQSFSAITGTIVSELRKIVDKAQQGSLDMAMGEMAALADKKERSSKEPTQAIDDGNTGLPGAIKAALVQWIGSQAEAKAPRDVTAWVVDKDLTDTSKQSFEVRLLINKRQLDSLATLLNGVIAAGRRGQISGEDFFTSLQAVSGGTIREMLKDVRSLKQSGLVPDFLSGLPYHSRLMEMDNKLWADLSADEQDRYLNDFDAYIQVYKKLHDSPNGWVKLNEGADADESVYPIPLELLP